MSEKQDSSESSDSQPEQKRSGGALKYFFWIIMLLIIAGAGSFLYLTSKGMSLTKETVLEMFDRYRPQTVQSSFQHFKDLQIKGTEGNILEVATGEETIELTREDTVKVLGRIVPGLRTTSKIMVPATFRYHIDLNGNWNLIEDGKRLHVIAPTLQPSLPIAFDSTKMVKINPGWTRYVSGSNMDELEKTITPELASRAIDTEFIELYEDEAKLAIAKFLRTWLVGEDKWAEGEFEEILVYFDGDLVDTENSNLTPDLKVGEALEDPVLP